MNCFRRAPARAALFSLLLLAPAFNTATRAQQAPGPDDVVLTVTVLDKKGAYVGGLEKSYFSVFDNNEPRDVTFFRAQQDEPASVGILLDASGSMTTPKIEKLTQALSRFMSESHPENEYFLIGFNERPQLLADWTRDADRILSGVATVKPKLNTALYDACYLGVEKIARARLPRRVLLLLSDGQDNASRFTFQELKKLLEESGVLLYSVGILGGNDPGSSLGLEGQSILESLSEIGGGAVYFPETSKELGGIMGRLAFELRFQYQLGFRPPDDARDGKWHKIKVKVNVPAGAGEPGLKIGRVRTREGYRAAVGPRAPKKP